MNKIDKIISSVMEALNSCIDSVRSQELWEDYNMIALPDLSPSEKTELITKINNFLHYQKWADLPTIMGEAKNAKHIMIYVDDVSSWWRFEA